MIELYRRYFVRKIYLLLLPLVLTGCPCLLEGDNTNPVSPYTSVEDLDRGHHLLIKKGLQIHGLVLDNVHFDRALWDASGFTTANFWAFHVPEFLEENTDMPWARWAGGREIENAALSQEEYPFLDTLISLQAGDEQDLRDPDNLAEIVEVLRMWREHYPNVIGYVNQGASQYKTVAAFMAEAVPDMIMMDTYPLNDEEEVLDIPRNRGGSPQRLYEHIQQFRKLALAGNDGSGRQPIPYALYTQTFYELEGRWNGIVSESQMYLNQFAAWAAGYKMVCSFIYNRLPNHGTLRPIFFELPDASSIPTERFYQVAELNRQARNLGAALVCLLSTDFRIVSGRYINRWQVIGTHEERIPLPKGVCAWTPGADPYLMDIHAENMGESNDGLPGDILIGSFVPLYEELDGFNYQGEHYFMIVNSLSSPESNIDDTRQKVHIVFDFGDSGITRLLRLSRYTGLVETVPLTIIGENIYSLDILLDGGTGDLFKYDTQAPFVGI